MPGKGWRKAPDGKWIPPEAPRNFIFSIDEKDKEFFEGTVAPELTRIIATNGAFNALSALLGNPAFIPIAAGSLGILAIVIYLKLKFPDPEAQAEEAVREAAEVAVELLKQIEETVDPPREEGQGPSTLDVLKENLVDLALRLWNDPLFGIGGQGPFIPGR